MALSKITTNSIADDAVTTAKVNPAQTDITSVGTLTSATVSGDLTVDTSTLKVDSSNNRVGVGLTDPSDLFEVSNSADTPTRAIITAEDSSGSNQNAFIKTKAKGNYYEGLEMASTSGHIGMWGGYYSGSAIMQARVGGSGINSSDNIALNINSNGHVFKPSQPLTVVRYAANTEHGSYNAGSNRNIIICKPSNVEINQGSHFNTSTGQFTCPVDGTYRVSFMGNYLNSDVSNYVLIQIRKNGSSVDQYYQDDLGTWNHVIRVAYITCSANDTLEVYNNSDSAGASKGGFDIVQYTAFNYSLVI